MKMLILYITLLFNDVPHTDVTSIPSDEPDITNEIFYHIYNQDFGVATQLLKDQKQNLRHTSYHWLLCDLEWWKAVAQNNPETYHDLETFLLQELDRVTPETHEQELLELIYLNYLVRLKSIQKERVKMLQYFFKIESFIKHFDASRLEGRYKSFYQIYLNIFKLTKQKYLPFTGIKKEPLINDLKQMTNSEELIDKTLATYFLVKVYLEITEEPYLVKGFVDDLVALYPRNKTFAGLNL
ncbi:MAG: hypothetical protein CR968_00725 [Flavobacteriia bacterium]|nr:MAG: hypothetical protein CR968_00725 [Flavobacteriia bacterium]